MKKKLLSLALATILTAGLVTGCGSSASSSDQSSSQDNTQKKTITVAASQTPHSEILAEAAKILEKQGYELKVTVFDDYVQPNNVVESGEFDANYMEHVPYMEQFNKENGTHIVNAGGIHYEPFGIYPGTKKKLDDLAEGDTIAIPNDTTNEARALLLLQDNGLLTLKDGAGLTATINDIKENPKKLKFQELEAEGKAPANIRFICMDANDLPTVFAPAEVSRIYLNFSDPWPKDRHAKRRLTSRQFFARYDQILKKEGHLEFKTDNQDLFSPALPSARTWVWWP